MTRVYLASDDSNLIKRVLRRYSGEYCLEVGAGNGGNLLELEKTFKLVVGTDLVRPERASNLVLADRATCFRDSVFDLVAFNPPYLPSEAVEDIAVDGGRDGVEVPLSFLEEAIRVVKPTGKIVILISNYNPLEKFKEFCAENGLKMSLLDSEDLFYERLSVYSVQRAEGPMLPSNRAIQA